VGDLVYQQVRFIEPKLRTLVSSQVQEIPDLD